MKKALSLTLGASLLFIMQVSSSTVSYASEVSKDDLKRAYEETIFDKDCLDGMRDMPKRFANQTKCIQGMSIIHFAWSFPEFLDPQGYTQLTLSSHKTTREIKDQLRAESPITLRSLNIDISKYGLDDLTLVRNLRIIKGYIGYHMIMDDNYQDTDYIRYFNKQIDTCYSHFNEFEDDPDKSFEIMDDLGLPQDIGWDSIDITIDGKKFNLGFDGIPNYF